MKQSVWNGYERFDFTVADREALMVAPRESAPGKPWVWRAEFFGAYAQADLALLERGWHLGYCKVSDMYGCPPAIQLMRQFHKYAVTGFGLADRAVLFGFSRGGLYAFHYAAEYPEHTAALYLDAPVLDIRSWPGGKGAGTGAGREWTECLLWYGLTDETSAAFRGNPLDKIGQVAQADIPIMLVAGDSDNVVPYGENGALLDARYRELGGTISTIVKRGAGHHPHSLPDPAPIVDFVVQAWEKRR